MTRKAIRVGMTGTRFTDNNVVDLRHFVFLVRIMGHAERKMWSNSKPTNKACCSGPTLRHSHVAPRID